MKIILLLTILLLSGCVRNLATEQNIQEAITLCKDNGGLYQLWVSTPFDDHVVKCNNGAHFQIEEDY